MRPTTFTLRIFGSILALTACEQANFEELIADPNALPDAPIVDPDAVVGPCVAPRTPVAPSASEFMWQGGQKSFRDDQQRRCTGRVAIAISDQALCFVASDDTLRCAGRIYTERFGESFVDTGQTGVDQILISPTWNYDANNRICVHKLDGTAWCMGESSAMFAASSTFVQWAGRGLVAIGTGDWNQLCELDDRHVRCAGLEGSPELADVGIGDRFWTDIYGSTRIDDPDVFRVSAGSAVCWIESGGLWSWGVLFHMHDRVVDGNEVINPLFGEPTVCWLEDSGSVFCSAARPNRPRLRMQRFKGGTALALAADPNTDSLCAVFNDGSLWCMGSNRNGKLGTGNTDDLLVETMVQPPGTVLTH